MTRPRPLMAFASGVALATNLVQLAEVSNPDGTPLRHFESRWHYLARQVAMEVGQIQRNLGIKGGNPAWTERP